MKVKLTKLEYNIVMPMQKTIPWFKQRVKGSLTLNSLITLYGLNWSISDQVSVSSFSQKKYSSLKELCSESSHP